MVAQVRGATFIVDDDDLYSPADDEKSDGIAARAGRDVAAAMGLRWDRLSGERAYAEALDTEGRAILRRLPGRGKGKR